MSRAGAALARDLAWVGCADPWAILVSEVMLQQTPAGRVEEPWRRFLELYPTPEDLANAPLANVLTAWRGLGYHRRARDLRRCAQEIVAHHAGRVPADRTALRALPGVGEYTANAVASFAFGAPVAVVDTNVGRVLARAVANRPLAPAEARDLATRMLGRRRSAPFNQAMIDLGAQFCRAEPRCGVCPIRRSCAWRRERGDDPAPSSARVTRPQARFEGSDRQWRGRVLERLRDGDATARDITRLLGDLDVARRGRLLEGLERDGLVERCAGRFALAR